MSIKGDQQTARALNRRLVLNFLRRSGPMSRAELAIRSGLSGATVGFVVAELMAEGLLTEGESAPSNGGRRPVPVELVRSSRFAIGFKLTARGLEGVLTDLSLEPITRVFEPIPDTRPETVVAHAARSAAELMVGKPPGQLIGIGLALPGSYDVERGLCTLLSRFGWYDVPLADMLAEKVAVPVWVDNDVNAFALAQYLFGHGRQHDNLMALAIGAGVGAAFMSQGRLHRGVNGAAGEIGHSIVVPDGRLCECGRRGCLQTYFSEAALSADWRALSETATGLPSDLAEAALAGVPDALSMLSAAGEGLAQQIAQVVNVIDPDIVIIGGEGVRFGSALRDPFVAALEALAYKSRPDVIFAWDDVGWTRGAAALAVERFFNFEAKEGTAQALA
jgi:predicted NBD/HSP70 family sugar kinase